MKDQGPWHQEVHEFGLNYRLPDILCALGISQLDRLNDFKNSRNEIFNHYVNELNEYKTIELPIKKYYVDPMWHLFPVRVHPKIRLALHKFLHDQGFKVQVNYLPAHLHPVFREQGYQIGQFPVSEGFYAREISLPIYAGLPNSEVTKISNILKKFLTSFSN
jgi:dTDP-4-amino-4,6-dideoxygalactose transaminase